LELNLKKVNSKLVEIVFHKDSIELKSGSMTDKREDIINSQSKVFHSAKSAYNFLLINNLLEEAIPPLVGIKEFAEILGWDKARISTKYSRQKSGKKVKDPLPDPIQILAATPIWTLKQAQEYKASIKDG
jgi:hypothetical protein